jgi:plastocyanin
MPDPETNEKGVATMKRLSSFILLIGAVAAVTAFAVVSASASTSSLKKVTQTMVIVGHSLGAQASDGLRHDTTLGASFTVQRGSRVTVTVYNYDEGPHTITAPKLGLNVTIPGAKNEEKGIASKKTFTFVTKKTGKFLWYCTLPCDAGQGYWDMKSPSKKIGFMAGYITVTA